MDPLTFLWENRTYLVIVPVLSLLMLVHELGHFITARLSGMTVEEFGFCFPPRIVGKEVGGVIYSLNWIPLGAFVRILGIAGNPTATLDEVQRATRGNAGQTVPFRILRDGEEISVPVSLRSTWP